MLIMPLLNRATVTYVIHMLYKRCTQRKQQARQTKLMSEKMYAVPKKGTPNL